MRLKYLITFMILVPAVAALAQVWQQTASTPEGSGVTDMLIR